MPSLAELSALVQALQGQSQAPATTGLRGSTLADLIKQPNSYYGYQVRDPYPTEHSYFSANPHVAGMAAEDGKITFNPFSPPNVNRDAVGANEAARLWMRENNFAPKFDVTPAQAAQFEGSPYQSNPDAMRQTIIGRILSNDPSAGNVTDHQRQISDWVHETLKARK